jgi:hypothetical protein
MRPYLEVSKDKASSRDLFGILQDARTVMISTARYKARELRKSSDEIRIAQNEADRLAIRMCTRCMTVSTFDEALSIVKEYVDIQIV